MDPVGLRRGDLPLILNLGPSLSVPVSNPTSQLYLSFLLFVLHIFSSAVQQVTVTYR